MSDREKYCPACSLSELYASELEATASELIARIPPEKRASDETFAARMSLCAACASYRSGLCEETGGYASVRAAKSAFHCPLGKWF